MATTAGPEEYLDRAAEFVERLPKAGATDCTVFPFLSKRNEPASAIGDHINRIRRGEVPLAGLGWISQGRSSCQDLNDHVETRANSSIMSHYGS